MEFSLENLVLKPLLVMLLEMLKWMLSLVSLLGAQFFEHELVQSILMLFQYVMYGMCVIGIIFALVDYVMMYIDGKVPIFTRVFGNIVRGFIAAMWMQKLMQLGYEVCYFLMQQIIQTPIGFDAIFSSEKMTELFDLGPGNTLIDFMISVFLVVVLVNLLIQLFERNSIFLLHQCAGVFYIVGICRGQHYLLAEWIRQGLKLCFLNFMQIVFFYVALSLLDTPTTIVFGLGMLVAAIRLEKILEQLLQLKSTHPHIYQGAQVAFKRSATL